MMAKYNGFLSAGKAKLNPKSKTIIGCHSGFWSGFAKGSAGADFFKG